MRRAEGTRVLWLAALCVVLGAASANAGMISATFPVAAANELTAGEVAGVVPAANWNNIWALQTPVVDDSGAASGATMTFTYEFAGTGPGSNAWPEPANNKMMAGHIYSNPGNNLISATITNLPYAQYDVYVYYNADGLSSNYQNVVVNGLTKMVFEDGTLKSSFVESVNGSNGNYVKFTGLSGTLSVSMLTNYGGATAFTYLTALQVVEVPEPATLVLLGVGGVLSVIRRRK